MKVILTIIAGILLMLLALGRVVVSVDEKEQERLAEKPVGEPLDLFEEAEW